MANRKKHHLKVERKTSKPVGGTKVQKLYDRLEAEAQSFFALANKNRAGTKAFQDASLKVLVRD
jgi:hypothetical protein